MSKVICDVCGTSYPETATQCPICGYVHTGESKTVSDVNDDKSASSGYTYVKGGRFSKANVRKRNRGAQMATVSASKKTDKEKSKSNNKGLIITIIVLILAIIAVIAYIYIKFFMPAFPTISDKSNDSTSNISDVSTSDNVSIDAADDSLSDGTDSQLIACTEILLDTKEISFDEIGQTATLHVNVLPANTTDSVSMSSSNTAVATVDENGKVTAVAEGQAVITVLCGDVSVTCNVTCEVVEESTAAADFRLNRQQITFDKSGSSWVVYSGEISSSEITWTTDDASVATVSNGKVTAVGEGSTTIYGTYNGTTQSCQIFCSFTSESDSGHAGNGGVSEDGGQSDNSQNNTSSNEYHLDNLFSQFDTNVTISVGESFPLVLVDSNGNKVEAVWSVQNSTICSVSNGDVTGVGTGETYVIATYNGREYRCYVRVV